MLVWFVCRSLSGVDGFGGVWIFMFRFVFVYRLVVCVV